MSKAEQLVTKVATWLVTAPRVTRFELHHRNAEGAPAVVEGWEAPAGRTRDAADRVVSAIWESAETHASAFGTWQLYAVIALAKSATKRGKADSESVGEFAFRIRGTATETSLSDSEPATGKGLLAALMRHNEVLLKSAMENVAVTLDRLNEMHIQSISPLLNENQSLRAYAVETEKMRLEMYQLREGMLNQKQERELAAKKAQGTEDRRERAMTMFNRILPKLLTGGAGGLLELVSDDPSSGDPKSGPDAFIVDLSAFARSLTREDAAGLRRVLSPTAMKNVVDSLQLLAMGGDAEAVKASVKVLANSFTGAEVDAVVDVIGMEKASALMKILSPLVDAEKGEEAH